MYIYIYLQYTEVPETIVIGVRNQRHCSCRQRGPHVFWQHGLRALDTSPAVFQSEGLRGLADGRIPMIRSNLE